MTRIAVVTVGRSDFSILHPLVQALDAHADFEAGFWLGGGHFDPKTGETHRDVRASGLPIWAEIPCTVFDPSPAETNRAMAEQMNGVARAMTQSNPDLVVILGDRFEAAAIGLALVPHNVPLAHISGGSVTEGAIDDVFRHCLSKMAAFHFCDLPAFARRIQAMGEAPERIFAVGALGLDGIARAERFAFEDLAAEFAFPEGFRPGYVLATLHPETRAPELTRQMADNLIAALRGLDIPVVFTYPNADPYSDQIIEAIEQLAAEEHNFHLVRNFGRKWFYTAMQHAGCVAGNSSSGIIEAASFRLPVVDIGDRQKGRYCEENVIHCGIDQPAISQALGEATGTTMHARLSDFQNPYGDGNSIARVIRTLEAVDWSRNHAVKAFVDADPTYSGKYENLR